MTALAVAERHGTTPGRDHGRLDAAQPTVDAAIVGSRPDQAVPIVGAANLELSDDDIAAIEGRA